MYMPYGTLFVIKVEYFFLAQATLCCSVINFLNVFVTAFTFWDPGYILDVPSTLPGDFSSKKFVTPRRWPFS